MAQRDSKWLDTLFPNDAERKVPWPETGEQVTLFRPVGLEELKLIAEANYRAFPPRLSDQPIFYPVLSFAYAEEIAQGWNTKYDSNAGFVTRFDVDGEYVRRFDIYIVGSEHRHRELWVPAEELIRSCTTYLSLLRASELTITDGHDFVLQTKSCNLV